MILLAGILAAPQAFSAGQTADLPRSEILAPNAFVSGAQGAALTLRGNDTTFDLSGLILRGAPSDAAPDERAGVGIRVLGRNVTIKNARVHGFKVGLYAQDAPGLKIIDSDFSHNWKQRLKSGLDKEDLSDWMSYHENDNDEWLRYGAAVYLRNCDGAEVRGLRVVGGQNGLMMTETDGALVWNSNLSFNSSIGIDMHRSSHNRIMHNRIDWNVRGYSHGVYNRGQDSTGILIYEQSNKNIFAYNSVTHGGDGFFLWAGQDTMDTGAGGCNDNLVYGNDFSHAPTNGIEATFSRNAFVNNLMMECWHGIWGGYSFDSLAYANVFAHNAEAIAWEHGQGNLIEGNDFMRNRQGIVMWRKPSEDPNWGYPKRRDTRAVENTLSHNRFWDTEDAVFVLNRTERTMIAFSQVERAGRLLRSDSENPNLMVQSSSAVMAASADSSLEALFDVKIDSEAKSLESILNGAGNAKRVLQYGNEGYAALFETAWTPWQVPAGARQKIAEKTPGVPAIPAPLKGGMNPFLKPGELRGRRYILVDEWGPYDFKSPRLWRRAVPELGASNYLFEVLGPPGKWRLKSATEGISVTESEGSVPGEVMMRIPEARNGQVSIEMEYIGGPTTDVRGQRTAAGRPVTFGWSEFRMPVQWTTRYWNYDAATQDPRTAPDKWRRVISGPPALVEKGLKLKKAWSGSPGAGVNANHFTTISEGVFEAPRGRHILDITSDDGVRVFLDGRMIHEDWTYHGPTTVSIPVELGGRHTIKIEHFELDGYSTIAASFRPAD
jgi:hypothetical protein